MISNDAYVIGLVILLCTWLLGMLLARVIRLLENILAKLEE